MKHYTGFPTAAMLQAVFDWLKPSAQYLKLWKGKATSKTESIRERRRKKLSLFDEFVLTFIRLRRAYDTTLLAFMFGITESHLSKIFTTWVCYLDRAFADTLLQYPSKETVAANLPASFKESAINKFACSTVRDVGWRRP